MCIVTQYRPTEYLTFASVLIPSTATRLALPAIRAISASFSMRLSCHEEPAVAIVLRRAIGVLTVRLPLGKKQTDFVEALLKLCITLIRQLDKREG
eukprot:208259-Prorocentrum_minimum.AAC.1